MGSNNISFFCKQCKTLVDLIDTYECPVCGAEYDKESLEAFGKGEILTIQEKKGFLKHLTEDIL